jgi:replicative DNA helicase
MEAIKLETELNLETIFTSITFDDLNKLNDILATKEIELQEKAEINKFIHLAKQTNKIPNIEILKREFPNLYFETYQILTREELADYISLYIAKKKNMAISKELMELSASVRFNGLDEATITKLNNITKSDVVEIEHKDIEEDILNIYNNKISMNGIKTGVKLVDSDTGGLQPGSLCTILGFTRIF